MSYRKHNLVENEFFHVFNRGNNKQTIFFDAQDFVRFQYLLYLANNRQAISVKDALTTTQGIYSIKRSAPLVAIGAYAIMSNHFHILISPLVEGGVSTFMQKVSTGYAMYFNKKYDRTGGIFENKFKSSLIDNDEYLKYLFAYIHLNILHLKDTPGSYSEESPESLHALDKAIQYRFSSLIDYVHGSRNESGILTTEHFPPYFEDEKDLKQNLLEWITYPTPEV